MMKTFIETNRFILREIIESDAQDFFELDSNPEVHKYLGNNPVTTIEQSLNAIKGIRKQYVENGIGRWAVVDKVTGELVGWSGLKYEEGIRAYGYYDLGYRLKEQHWGKGIATETAKASLKYGFENLGYNQISAAAHVENIGSNAVLKKVGFKLLEQFNFDNEDHNWYSITKEEWKLL